MEKTKDLFLNIAANPRMTLEDLVSVGITSDNTMLLDRASYASNEKVQAMFQDENGNFDEKTFNTFYDIAEKSYNILASDDVNLNLMDVTAYDADNIFVDPSKRRQVNAPIAVKLPNPDRLNVGLTRIGKVGERTLSQDEIAQSQEVLLNPVEVANGAKPIYGKSPNDSWFEDFWDTRVMAAWDEDGVHIDPVTGREVQHMKGDLKLNENGTYYYESLDGRSVYGKRVLNKFNTLTTDGSAWNKYDFFDSDDIEQKSAVGSIAKNLALVGSMFIPYVGWGIAAASVAHQSAGLFATLGKMLAGSDSPSLNALEGWVKSTDRRNLKTEYAQQNMWCWENFIDLIGDTTAQLREQRAIFKFVPGIIKGDFKAINDKAMKSYTEKLAKEGLENATTTSFRDLAKLAHKQNPGNASKQLRNLIEGAKDIYSARAEKIARDYVTNYYKLGEPIAKAYMTAITVQDTFGEAIEAGASDSEATLLTLGYAAAEAALLSTDLGKWIMPELRSDRQRYKMIANKLLELPQETREMSKQVARLGNETKKEWAKRLFNIGKDIMRAEYSTATKTLGSIAAQGLGEGIEEVSEELLADFSKSCFNLVQQLQGDDVRMSAWDNMKDRYLMSFAGGIMGGGINAAASDYKVNRDLVNMNSQQALQQLVYMTRNDELDDFWDAVNKTELAPKNLSTQLNDSGTGYKPGTKNDNQDLEAKRALKRQVDLIESIINAENAKLNDGGLLSTLIKADPSLQDLDPVKEYRMRALSNSATAGRFLNEWNTITSDIVKTRVEQHNIISKYGDVSQEKYSDEDKQRLKNLEKTLKNLQQRKDSMLSGERTREYVRDAMFEMTHAVNEVWDNLFSEVRFAEAMTGKKYKDIAEDKKKELKEQYEQIKNSNQKAEQIHALADVYESLAMAASNGIQESANYIEDLQKGQYANLNRLDRWASARLSGIMGLLSDPDQGVIKLQEYLQEGKSEDILTFVDSDQLRATVEAHLQNNNIGAAAEVMFFDTFAKINDTCDEILKAGFVHPETKNLLTRILTRLDAYATDIIEDWELDNTKAGALVNLDEKRDELLDKLSKIEKLSNTPILENLKKFQLSTNTDKSVLDLIDFLIKKEEKESGDISTFQIDTNNLALFDDARKLLEMYRSAIVGARYDNVDIDSIVGFNTTLNELSGTKDTIKLAEINAQTADLILEDINTILKRLDYAEGLHSLNAGNKFNVQNKTAINKQYILYNRINKFISTVQDDDDWKDKEGDDTLAQLVQAVANAQTLQANSGLNATFEARNFGLNPRQKEEIEKESINIQTALHNFLAKRIDGSDASIDKLAKLLNYDNFKGLIRENNDYLDQNSVDIDDSAFIWWLCATAALNPDQFYNNYRQIIGDEANGEKPIAPIPTQELGVFALTAAVVNGNMFNIFGKALRKSLLETWNKDPETRAKIQEEAGQDFFDEDHKEYFKNSDFLPNFDNILFVEGIAGSGKSTGVLKSWSKLMAKVNPDFVANKIIFAHTSKTKAENLAKSTSFTNYDAHDHDSLLSYMSPDYRHQDSNKYILGRDALLVDGMLRSPWKLRVMSSNDVPKVIVIDEWSHYNQLEQELIQRFAQNYGVTVLTMGDYDQLTPSAVIVKDANKDHDAKSNQIYITPNRNMTARVAKLGVSMRTDNEVKNGNIYRMLAWKKNPTDAVDLHYYEDETGIYGDKRYGVSNTYGDVLNDIKADVQTMIKTLKPNEVIGYVYSDQDSELYKWLTTTDGIKEHIKAMVEKDAHGLEAQYYIVENNRQSAQDALEYFSSVYTGMTRSEQGSIIITNTSAVKSGQAVGPNSKDKYNREGLLFRTVKDSEMVPNTFTDIGTREFARKRKEVFDRIYGTREIQPFDIIPRNTESISIIPSTNTPVVAPSISPSVSPTSLTTPTTGTSTEPVQPAPTSTPQPTTPEVVPSINEVPSERVESEVDVTWQGPLDRNQMVFGRDGVGKFVIIGEDLSDPSNPKYFVKDVATDAVHKADKSYVASRTFTKVPQEFRLFNIGDKVYKTGGEAVISDIYLKGPADNPRWVYKINDSEVEHDTIKRWLELGRITREISETEEVPTHILGINSPTRQIAAIDEEMEAAEQRPTAVIAGPNDISFNLLGYTFNNQYFADEFDDHGNLIPLQGSSRIDNGYGLYACVPNRFNTKDAIQNAVGAIRRRLEFFENNSDITVYVQQLTGKTDVTMRWGFISKGSDKNKDKYSRFDKPKATLEYMGKEDSDVPSKTLSAIFYDNAGKPFLEIPMITLQSPHSIFIDMKKAGIGKDVTDKWIFGQKASQETFDCLTNIIQYIESTYPNSQGYKNLASVLKLWLFTSNGVKMLGDSSWNFHKNVNNLGNLYVTSRTSDTVIEHDFKGQWVSLSEAAQRRDRFISRIFMNKQNVFVEPGTSEALSIFRPYTPYVFISDDPRIDSDTKAAKRYLEQLKNPTLEKTVKVIPVIEPEVSVSTYIDAMHGVLTGQSKAEPYGNEYTPYRVWEAILASPDRDTIMRALPNRVKQFVVEYVDKLHQIEAQNPQQSGESNIDYSVRLANAINPILRDSYVTVGSSTGRVFEKLRMALVDCCHAKAWGTDANGGYTTGETILPLIEKAFKDAGNTGVLCKSHFAPDQIGREIAGFATPVNVDGNNKYHLPGQASYRIFGKIDPPTYNMNNLLGMVESWVKDARLGKEIKNSRNEVTRILPNVWEFIHDDANKYYLESDIRPRINLSNVLQKANALISRLGITEYNIGESELASYDTEAKALAKAITIINQKYLENNGAFIITDSRGELKYGNIITEQTPEFKNYKFDSVTVDNGAYKLRFMNLDTNSIEELEMSLDPASNSFFVTPPVQPTQITSFNVSENKPNIENSIMDTIFWEYATPETKQILQQIFDCFDETTNTVDVNTIEQLLQQADLGLVEDSIRESLMLNQLNGEPQQDICINPIKISFK